ncbi:MAG: bifunctional nuclease family protein [Leptospiraceae bacterium]|nr:bifunctional nuclease family protein [Leptospiraceae bacterium]MBK7055403.1 bifunctional nuclease family protein [Leptospiraceae bacterium]MBK9502460.1 bifunctional nuclease family protein [Leptospiraceae bacterium]MBL0264533.1 bifunctional nuclease family protein [Leptospiraceae bacterium]MBP9163788.1 bifunctional nuclease family protein [Leptospiraceae bacterium]
MDLIEVKISDITLTNVGFAVFLKPKEETADSKVVPIFIGPLETHAITSVLDGITPPRPMTHDLIMMFIPVLGAQVIKVTIDEIIDNTFYAKISIRKDEEIFLIDARPSDSIAIALRAEAPIFITQSVLDEAGVVMKGGEIPSESGLDELTPVEPVPRTQLQILEESLSVAIKNEDYESAARIRDQIKKIIGNS